MMRLDERELLIQNSDSYRVNLFDLRGPYSLSKTMVAHVGLIRMR